MNAEPSDVLQDVDVERMNSALRSLKTTLTWDRIRQAYITEPTRYKSQTFDELTFNDLTVFAEVFQFNGTTCLQLKKELGRWVRDYPAFYNDSLEVMYNNMKTAILKYIETMPEEQRLQAMNNPPKVNYLPEYGGILQESGNGRLSQLRWLADHNIISPLTGNVWQMPPEKSQHKKAREDE